MKNLNYKTAVILFNLGGPDKLDSVKEFLFNLFNDKAIIGLPQPLRFLLARLISSRREKKAQNIYSQIGGKSPLLDITLSQADSLQRELSFDGNYKVFVDMRYWHPMSKEVAKKVKEYAPNQIILMPLYPQFSSTTSGSSIENFLRFFDKTNEKIKIVCCYPIQDDFIRSHAMLIKQTIEKISTRDQSKIRLLFSAHGLPQKVINSGDPYVFQINETTNKIIEFLNENKGTSKIDFSICYQSKVGPLQWTSPSLEYEIRRVSLDKKIPVIIPIAFVSDHSETLVELDIEYRDLAKKIGIESYFRVPSLNLDGNFIKALAKICQNVAKSDSSQIFCAEKAERICPKNFKLCLNPNPCRS